MGILLILPSQYAEAEPVKLNMVFVPASEKGDDNDYVGLIKISKCYPDLKSRPSG